VFQFTCLISSFLFNFLESAGNKAPPILKSSLRQFYGRNLGWPLRNICVTNDYGYVPLVVSTSQSFPRSWLITGFVTRLTRRVSLVEQELLTLPDHLGSPSVFSGVRATRSLFLYVCFADLCLSFCTFLLAIILSVLLRYTDSDYPFGIFKLFLLLIWKILV
jgi:hypothetical protein